MIGNRVHGCHEFSLFPGMHTLPFFYDEGKVEIGFRAYSIEDLENLRNCVKTVRTYHGDGNSKCYVELETIRIKAKMDRSK